MVINTPKILPGEKGYVSLKIRNLEKKKKEKEIKRKENVKESLSLGHIRIGGKGYRIGKPRYLARGDVLYPLWRYSKNIGKIIIHHKNLNNESIELIFKRLGGVGNYKHLIEDADFQLKWMVREQELIITQEKCYVCRKNLSKNAKPYLYHFNMWKKRTELFEKAEKVPLEVVNGSLTIEEGWELFNAILEKGNRYFMALKDTALVCSSCAKEKGVNYI